MASYSNSPNVSGNLFSQILESTPAWTATGGFGRYKLFYTVPANSYAVINFSLSAQGLGASDKIGLVFNLPSSYASGFSFLEVSTSSTYVTKDSIYIGPGTSVYLLINNSLVNASVAATLSGVQLTNGA